MTPLLALHIGNDNGYLNNFGVKAKVCEADPSRNLRRVITLEGPTGILMNVRRFVQTANRPIPNTKRLIQDYGLRYLDGLFNENIATPDIALILDHPLEGERDFSGLDYTIESIQILVKACLQKGSKVSIALVGQRLNRVAYLLEPSDGTQVWAVGEDMQYGIHLLARSTANYKNLKKAPNRQDLMNVYPGTEKALKKESDALMKGIREGRISREKAIIFCSAEDLQQAGKISRIFPNLGELELQFKTEHGFRIDELFPKQ